MWICLCDNNGITVNVTGNHCLECTHTLLATCRLLLKCTFTLTLIGLLIRAVHIKAMLHSNTTLKNLCQKEPIFVWSPETNCDCQNGYCFTLLCSHHNSTSSCLFSLSLMIPNWRIYWRHQRSVKLLPKQFVTVIRSVNLTVELASHLARRRLLANSIWQSVLQTFSLSVVLVKVTILINLHGLLWTHLRSIYLILAIWQMQTLMVYGLTLALVICHVIFCHFLIVSCA